jgi:hypothetical protein
MQGQPASHSHRYMSISKTRDAAASGGDTQQRIELRRPPTRRNVRFIRNVLPCFFYIFPYGCRAHVAANGCPTIITLAIRNHHWRAFDRGTNLRAERLTMTQHNIK